MVKTDMVFFWVIVLRTLTGNHSEDALFHLALWPTTVEKKAENEHSQRHDQDSFIINDILQCKMSVLCLPTEGELSLTVNMCHLKGIFRSIF